MPKIWSRLKPYLRWVILGGTLFFLAKALKDHAAEVSAIRITGAGWVNIAIALCLTLLAHTWAGWVWNLILQSLQQPVQLGWVLQVYLKTNLAKYLPGNVWHYYGRILAVTSHGGDLGAATLSVLLEPLLMAAAALLIALLGTQQEQWGLQVFCLAIVCLAVHPRILNPAIQLLSRMKAKQKDPNPGSSYHLEGYPLLPLLGELGFLVLRGGGFLFVLLALTPIHPNQILTLFGAFSMAWLLGLVVPGAPGGIGVFEATATALLARYFSPAVILSAVALFRVVSILAEVAAAGMATVSDRVCKKT